jgi:hypothetical protein
MAPLWKFLTDAWRSRWLGFVFIGVSFIFAVVWYFRIPPPGYSLIVMGVAASILALRPDMPGSEKWLWTLALFALGWVEIHAIVHDRTDAANAEERRREEQNAKFKGIADGLTASIKQNQADFDTTIAGLSRSVNLQTGGRSYLYFDPQLPMGPFEVAVPGVPIGTMIMNTLPHFVGKFPLRNVYVSVDGPRGMLPDIDYGTYFPAEIGRPRQILVLPFMPDKAHQYFNIFINTSNGTYEQTVLVHKFGDKWLWASRFFKDRKLVRVWSAKGFPKGRLNGNWDKDWDKD